MSKNKANCLTLEDSKESIIILKTGKHKQITAIQPIFPILIVSLHDQILDDIKSLFTKSISTYKKEVIELQPNEFCNHPMNCWMY